MITRFNVIMHNTVILPYWVVFYILSSKKERKKIAKNKKKKKNNVGIDIDKECAALLNLLNLKNDISNKLYVFNFRIFLFTIAF